MTDKGNIYAGMAAVMTAVQSISKNGRNEAQHFLFRGIDAVMNAVGPALRDQGIVVTSSVREYIFETVEVGKARTPMSHARVVVGYTFHAQDGTSLPTESAGEAMDSGDKATPKAMSVAYRTALLQALCIPTDDPEPDAEVYQRATPVARAKTQPKVEGQAKVETSPEPGSPVLRTDDQSKKLWTLASKVWPGDKDTTAAALRAWLTAGLGREVESTKTLTRTEAAEANAHLADMAHDAESGGER